MEELPQKKKLSEIPEHPGEQPELQIVPAEPEIDIGKKKISPEQLDDLIKNSEKQWDEDDKRKDKDTPTLH